MRKIDASADERHFVDHLAPVWKALPADVRGKFYVGGDAVDRARHHGIHAIRRTASVLPPAPAIALVASKSDLLHTRSRWAVLMEHGSGQSYSGRHGNYAGGEGRDNVALFLNPNQQCADRNALYYPDARSVVIGCPKLDQYLPDPPEPTSHTTTVAIGFHWHGGPVTETQSAWPTFSKVLPELAAQRDFHLIGHGHPRMLDHARKVYDTHGIEVVGSFDEVIERAHVFVCDNSSAMFEFAALGRAVVVMNAPAYRRSINHGGRFWDWAAIGPNVDQPKGLLNGIFAALEDRPRDVERRRRIVADIYPVRDGTSTQRAVDEILELAASKVSGPPKHVRGKWSRFPAKGSDEAPSTVRTPPPQYVVSVRRTSTGTRVTVKNRTGHRQPMWVDVDGGKPISDHVDGGETLEFLSGGSGAVIVRLDGADGDVIYEEAADMPGRGG